MTIEEAKTIQIGSIVSPRSGHDKGIHHRVISINPNPYRTSKLEIQITAIPIQYKQIKSDYWKQRPSRTCFQQGWKLISV